MLTVSLEDFQMIAVDHVVAAVAVGYMAVLARQSSADVVARLRRLQFDVVQLTEQAGWRWRRRRWRRHRYRGHHLKSIVFSRVFQRSILALSA